MWRWGLNPRKSPEVWTAMTGRGWDQRGHLAKRGVPTPCRAILQVPPRVFLWHDGQKWWQWWRLQENARRYLQLLPGFYGQVVGQADCHCRNQRAGECGRAAEVGAAAAMGEDINRVQTDVKYDFVYVDEESFEKYKPTSFRQLLEALTGYKGGDIPVTQHLKLF
jgi:hypothetical protein